MGLREQKKARTRRMISDVALKLFLERGYHAVTTAEIAEAAEVSAGTLFNYFPTKEALVFDEDRSLEDSLIAAVIDRPAGQGILDALRQAILDGPYLRFQSDAGHAQVFALIRSTPELASYTRHMALRYEGSIARAIGQSTQGAITEPQAQAIAHHVLQSLFAAQSADAPTATFNALIDLLKNGFTL